MYWKTSHGIRAQIVGYGPATCSTFQGDKPAIDVRYDYGVQGEHNRDHDLLVFELEEDRDTYLRWMDHGDVRVVDPSTAHGAAR